MLGLESCWRLELIESSQPSISFKVLKSVLQSISLREWSLMDIFIGDV